MHSKSRNISQQKKLSVVQVIDRLNTGGAETVLVNLANLLYQHGHEVTVVTTVSKGPLAAKLHPQIPVIDLQRRWKWNPLTMHKLVKVLQRFDVVHVHSSFNLRYLFLSAKLFGLRKPIFFHEHFGDINIDQSVPWTKKYIYPKVVMIAVSKQIADWASQKLKMDREKVFVLPNIVLKEKTSPVKKAAVNFVLVANFRPTKNIAFALEVFDTFHKTTANSKLTLIGQIADNPYYQSLLKSIKEKQLQDSINIVTNCNSVQSLLPGFDLALHTAVSESGPLVLIEYLAQQLPFLTYNTGEVVQQLKPEIPEMIMDNFDTGKWIARINQLLDARNSEKLQVRLQNTFSKYYNAENYYNNCIKIYNTILQKNI